MGMAKVNVWVSGMDDPCAVDDSRTWYVTFYDCDGNVLQWCGRKYAVMPARCGHLEVEVPPGIYYIKAVWGYTVVRPGIEYRVNHFTDATIVQASCDQTTCVKLFNPSAHRCGTILVRAVADLLRQKVIRAETANKVTAGLEELLAQLPKPLKAFEIGHLDEIETLVRQQEGKGGRQAKEDPDPEAR